MFRSFTSAALVAFVISAVQGAPTPRRVSISLASGPVRADEYIVKLKSGASAKSHVSSLPFAFSVADDSSPISHVFDEAFGGYAGRFVGSDLDAILASPDVDYVQPNQILKIFTEESGAPWGLQSISTQKPVGGQNTDALSYSYFYDSPAGKGVDIYIVDTGINIKHEEFEGRATWGFSAPKLAKDDDHGHGTHCAGSAAGKTFGLAKNANLIAVKVLDNEGSGSTADIVAGIEFVVNSAKKSRRPSVGSMSLGGTADQALDDAVAAAIQAGVVFTVAAGNESVDAGTTSPARLPAAITVGAIDINNQRAQFSNFGSVVDVFAPGVDIISSWIGSTTATNKISGTSMATPHVAGLSAYLLGKEPTMTPDAVAAKIKSLGTKGVIKGLPGKTVNLLAYNGGEDGSAPPTNPSDTEAPLPSDTVIPTDPETEIPIPTGSDLPLPSDTDLPFPSDTDLPFPSDTDLPFPSDDPESPFPTDFPFPFPFPGDDEPAKSGNCPWWWPNCPF